MIATVEEVSPPYMVDIGRPSFIDDEGRAFWKKFYDLVDTSPYPIVVNSMFDTVREMLDEGRGYMGGGFRFCFFFATKDDRKQFINDVEKLGEYAKIRDHHNVVLFQNIHGATSIRATQKYMDSVVYYISGNDNLGVSYDSESLAFPVIVDGPIKDLLSLREHLRSLWVNSEI